MTLESFEKIDADNQLVAIGEKLEETSIKDLSSYSLDPAMLIPKFESCSDLKKDSSDDDGLYTLWSNDQQKFIPTLCKFDSTGSYAVMQSRVKDKTDGTFHFTTIDGYTEGFGSSFDKFWLGLERIHEITRSKPLMKIVLSNDDIVEEYVYEDFSVSSKEDAFRLSYGSFKTDGSVDSLSFSRGAPFVDRRVSSFGDEYRCFLSGGWWFNCTTSVGRSGFSYSHVQSNLNGLFSDKTDIEKIRSNRWEAWPFELNSYHEFTETEILLSN